MRPDDATPQVAGLRSDASQEAATQTAPTRKRASMLYLRLTLGAGCMAWIILRSRPLLRFSFLAHLAIGRLPP